MNSLNLLLTKVLTTQDKASLSATSPPLELQALIATSAAKADVLQALKKSLNSQNLLAKTISNNGWNIFPLSVDAALNLTISLLSQQRSIRAEHRSVIAERASLFETLEKISAELTFRRKPSTLQRFRDRFLRADARLTRARESEKLLSGEIKRIKVELDEQLSDDGIKASANLVDSLARISFCGNPDRSTESSPEDSAFIFRLTESIGAPKYSTNYVNAAAAQRYLHTVALRRERRGRLDYLFNLTQQLFQARQAISAAEDAKATTNGAEQDSSRAIDQMEKELTRLQERLASIEGNYPIRLESLLSEYASVAKELLDASLALCLTARYLGQEIPAFPLSELLASDERDEVILSKYVGTVRSYTGWLARQKSTQTLGCISRTLEFSIDQIVPTKTAGGFECSANITFELLTRSPIVQDFQVLSMNLSHATFSWPDSQFFNDANFEEPIGILGISSLDSIELGPRTPGNLAGQPLPQELALKFFVVSRVPFTVQIRLYFLAFSRITPFATMEKVNKSFTLG